MMRTHLAMAVFLLSTLVGPSLAQTSGKMLGDTCAGCHGTLGVSAGMAMPTLAGMPAEFIRLAMSEFRDGKRFSTIMGRIAKGYSDDEIAAMAAYLSAQCWQPAIQQADVQLAALGKRVHHKKCEACHRDNGSSTALDMPRVAGQWRGYLELVLAQSRDSKRAFHRSPDMKMVVDRLTDRDVAALTHYYASQE